MTQTAFERTISKFLYIGAPFVTVLVVSNSVTDPVNITKFFGLGVIGSALFAVFIFSKPWQIISQSKWFIGTLAIFLLASFNAVLSSDSPFEQNFYGTYGRSTGFLSYVGLSFFMLASLAIRSSENYKKILNGFMVAGVVNVIYCAWVLAFGDFIGWNNIYGEILGLFGNPDFISAFLGMFIVGVIARILQEKMNWRIRFIGIIVCFAALYEIIKSKAIQGLMVTAGGIVVIGFFYLYFRVRKNSLTFSYVVISVTLGVLAVLGIFQKGPLDFLYKRSVSLRGSYWRSALDMGKDHLFTGVGMDSYGDWYKRARPPAALIDLPPINTVSNVSHNVFLDFFAFGGLPLVLSYLVILIITIISIIKYSRRQSKFDSVFVSMTVIWICYQVQSIISINQIGLAIWGWILSGLLISYEVNSRSLSAPNQEPASKTGALRGGKVSKSNSQIISPNLMAGIGVVAGILVFLPPLNADMKWFAATKTQNAKVVQEALVPSYFNPSSSNRYQQAISLFQSSGLSDIALKYAKEAVKFNPDDSASWLMYYHLPNSSTTEKAIALRNAKRLDPKNPDVLAP